MFSTFNIRNNVSTETKDHPIKSGGWTRYATGAVCGLAGGVLFPIVGGFLMAAATVHSRAHNFNHYLGIVLHFLTLPLLVFGICCLVRIVDDSILKS
jgi:predicted Na+-dependent transporter